MPDKLIEVFAECLDVAEESLDDESSPETVEAWDSMASMRLVVDIEDTFKVEFTTAEVVGMQTIGIVRQVLREKGASGV